METNLLFFIKPVETFDYYIIGCISEINARVKSLFTMKSNINYYVIKYLNNTINKIEDFIDYLTNNNVELKSISRLKQVLLDMQQQAKYVVEHSNEDHTVI